MKKVEVNILRGYKWQVEGNLMLKERKVYMLKNEELRMEIIQLYHNILTAGHRERWKTSNKKLLVARSDKEHGKICGQI